MPRKKKAVDVDSSSVPDCLAQITQLRSQFVEAVRIAAPGSGQSSSSRRIDSLAMQLSAEAQHLERLVEERERVGSIRFDAAGEPVDVTNRLDFLGEKLAQACRGHLDQVACEKASQLLRAESPNVEDRLDSFELVIQLLLKSSQTKVNVGHVAWVTEVQDSFFNIGKTVQLANSNVTARLAELQAMEVKLLRACELTTNKLCKVEEVVSQAFSTVLNSESSCSRLASECRSYADQAREAYQAAQRIHHELECAAVTEGKLDGLQSQIVTVRRKLAMLALERPVFPEPASTVDAHCAHSTSWSYSQDDLDSGSISGFIRHSTGARRRATSAELNDFGTRQLKQGEPAAVVTRTLQRSAAAHRREVSQEANRRC